MSRRVGLLFSVLGALLFTVSCTMRVFAVSTYPVSRQVKDPEGRPKGNMGSVELLNARIIAQQPFVSFDWCAEKEGLAATTALDQSLRVLIVTKLNKY